MITSQDALDIQKALNLSVQAGNLTPAGASAIVDRIIAMIPPPATPVPRCTRCGRQQGDSQNLDCDMQPCTFV